MILEPGNISDLLSVLSGPYNDTFLGDYTSMTGNKTFDAFEDAKSAAMADPEAGGITKNSAGILVRADQICWGNRSGLRIFGPGKHRRLYRLLLARHA